MVSGSLSLAAQACFSPFPHGTRPLSVTRGVFSLGGWSPQLHARIPRAPALLRNPLRRPSRFRLPGSHRLWRAVPGGFTLASYDRVRGSYNPAGTRPHGLGSSPFRSPLLGESRLISLPPGTEMFQFPGLALPCGDDGARAPPGFPIRPSRDHSLCAAPPGLSQLTTAFIASRCQGIHRVPYCA